MKQTPDAIKINWSWNRLASPYANEWSPKMYDNIHIQANLYIAE